MKHRLLGLPAVLLWCCGGALAAGAPESPAGQGAPTRLQHCQREVGDASGDVRKRALRDCLLRRSEGEAGVLADCRRQLRIRGNQPSAAQQRQLHDCEARSLAVPSQQLPRRPPPPPPRVAPAAAASPSPRPVATPPRPVLPGRLPASPREGA